MKVPNVWGKSAALALVTLGALVILVYYYQTAGGRLPNAATRYSVSATVAEPQQLLKHADVRAAGIKVGEVREIVGRGDASKITMDLEQEVVPLYRDATVLVRQKTLVGENYVEVRRGTPSKGVLPTGSSLEPSASEEAVPIDRILNSLDKETRESISTNLRALGGGLEGHGADANRTFMALRPLISDGTKVTDVLDAQHEQVADLISQGSTVFEAVADRRADLRSLLRSATITAKTVSARDQQLKQAFKEFPSTLTQAQGTVNRLAGFSDRAIPTLANLRFAVQDLEPVVKDLRPTAASATTLLNELPLFTKQANPLLKELKTFSKTTGPALPAFDSVLRQANPALDFLKPYNRDVSNLLSIFGTHYYGDKFGGQGICQCPVGERSFANYTPAMREAMNVLLQNGLVQQSFKTANNHYRQPGTAPKANESFRGTYPRILNADTGK